MGTGRVMQQCLSCQGVLTCPTADTSTDMATKSSRVRPGRNLCSCAPQSQHGSCHVAQTHAASCSLLAYGVRRPFPETLGLRPLTAGLHGCCACQAGPAHKGPVLPGIPPKFPAAGPMPVGAQCHLILARPATPPCAACAGGCCRCCLCRRLCR
jgi:hypothetical protein